MVEDNLDKLPLLSKNPLAGRPQDPEMELDQSKEPVSPYLEESKGPASSLEDNPNGLQTPKEPQEYEEE